MAEHFGKTRDLSVAERTGKLGLLLPGTEEERKVHLPLVRVAVKEGAKHQFRRWFDSTAALADYREGEFAVAEKRARKVLDEGNGQWNVLVATRSVLAMALHRLGKTERRKRNSGKQSISWMPRRRPWKEPGVPGMTGSFAES
jgi:hypothetical protein